MKPKILYLDDEPHNLTVFEASLPDDWEVKVYTNAMEALGALETFAPWVIVSDQRMPNYTGVQFLELSKKVLPHAMRVIVTGYSDENLVVESVRKAQIFDYIKKPWDADELVKTLKQGIELYRASEESRTLQEALKVREQELQTKTISLLQLTNDLEQANKREKEMRAEVECWVPPFVLWALNDKKISFPIKRDIVGITYDIIDCGKLHDVHVNGKPLRALIIQHFSEAIMRHGGWRESHSGDSAYGHFGMLEDKSNPFDSALAVAREFRVALRSLASVNKVELECGLALHIATDSIIDVHTVQLNTPRGITVQKSFDTTSAGIDLLHRIEKLMHTLPGTNIAMSSTFIAGLTEKPPHSINIGSYLFKGQAQPIELTLVPSDKVTATHIEELKKNSIESLKKVS
jgi:FixJ family two-component response regulator